MGEVVEFKANGGTDSGYLAVPDGGSGPGVIVIQEWWGLVDHIKDVCERFAGAGFVALAPDLYHGKTTKSPDEAGKLMMAMRVDEAEKDIGGAIQYLLNNDAVIGKKVGVVGFCMGGALALYSATKNANVGACAVFYGGHPKVKPDLPSLQSPVVYLSGDRDKSVTPEVVHKLEEQLKSLGKQIDVVIYPNADHAFFNDTRPAVYNPDAASDSWRRTIDLFKKNLG